MQVKYIYADRREEWNSLAAQEASFALMQSWEWGEFKSKTGWKVYRVSIEDKGRISAGAQLLIKQLPLNMGSIAYIPRGPIGNCFDDRITSLLLSELHTISCRHNAIFLKIEPPLLDNSSNHSWLSQNGFRSSPQNNQPRSTLILDITQEKEVLLKQMRKKTAQYIRKSIRTGIQVRHGNEKDIITLYDLMKVTAKRDGFHLPSFNYFEDEWQTFNHSKQYCLLMAYYQNEILAVRTVHIFDKHAAEFHAGSTDKFAHLYPNHLLTWEAINWAKDQGCRSYDLWGIPDEVCKFTSNNEPSIPDRHDGLWGVYQFKRGFTKNIVCYVGAYDYVYQSIKYNIISKYLNNQNIRESAIHWMVLIGSKS